jgi:hypothetical protein
MRKAIAVFRYILLAIIIGLSTSVGAYMASSGSWQPYDYLRTAIIAGIGFMCFLGIKELLSRIIE